MDKKTEATQFQETHRVEKTKRPVYHAAPPTGWMNDPNGFSVYDGRIHLFYQYHPYRDIWGPMHWGHLTSDDYVTWDDLPVALAPDMKYDASGCFSGSAISFGDRHVLIYTGCEERAPEESIQAVAQQQCLAAGDGVNYEKSPHNPIIPTAQLPDEYAANEFRDPKVWERDGRYCMVVAAKDKDQGLGHVLMYESDNLTDWSFRSVVASSDGKHSDMWECPDLFSLDGTDILMVSRMNVRNSPPGWHDGFDVAAYRGKMNWDTGQFDIEDVQPLDQGVDFYAAQTLHAPDGRRIMVAWMQAWENFIKPAHQKWHGMMTFPRELAVKNGRLLQSPIRELESVRTDAVIAENVEIAGIAAVEIPGVRGRVVDLTVQILEADCDSMSIAFADGRDCGVQFEWTPGENVIRCTRELWGASKHTTDRYREQTIVLPDGTKLQNMRFLVDRSSIELFVNDGETVFSVTYYAPAEADSITFAADGPVRLKIEKYAINPDRARDASERTVSENEKSQDQAELDR